VNATANRKHKDSVFTALFDDNEKLLSLYNAITGSELPLDTPVKIATLDSVLFMDRQNDIAFVINGKLVILIEHQSSINANMPFRLLIYIARVYEKLVDKNSVYRSKLLKIPKPDFIVLYNGTDPFPDEKLLRLSDAFMDAPEVASGLGGFLELEVRVVNINEGRNEDVLKKCKTLSGYAHFIGKAREYLEMGYDLKAALTKAINDCIEEGILVDFLKKHSSEVLNMLTAEWNIEDAKKVWLEEGREEGREEGLEEGVISNIVKLICRKLSKKKTREQIIDELDLDESEIKILDNISDYTEYLSA